MIGRSNTASSDNLKHKKACWISAGLSR